MRIYKGAVLAADPQPCTFRHILPDKACPRPGLRIEMLMALIRVVHKTSEPWGLQVFPVIKADASPINTTITSNTTMGYLVRGETDFTHPISLSKKRWSLPIRFADPPVITPTLLIVYKQATDQERNLDIASLFIGPFGIWFGLFLSIGLILVSNLATGQYIPEWCTLTRNVAGAAKVLWFIMIQLFIELLANYICIYFAVPVPPPPHFASVGDALEQTAAGRAHLMGKSAYLGPIFRAEEYKDLVSQSEERGTLEVIRNESAAIEAILAQPYDLGFGEKRLALVGTDYSHFLPKVLCCYCDLRTLEVAEFRASRRVFYSRGDLPLNLTVSDLIQLYYRYRKVVKLYYPFRGQCEAKQVDYVTSIGNLQGVFIGACCAMAVPLLLFALEKVLPKSKVLSALRRSRLFRRRGDAADWAVRAQLDDIGRPPTAGARLAFRPTTGLTGSRYAK